MSPLPTLILWLVMLASSAGTVAIIARIMDPWLRRAGAVARRGPDGLGRTVPRGGGLAIVLMGAVAAAVATAWSDSGSRVWGWLGPALVVAAVSFWDDLRPLPALLRLAVHVAAAAAVVLAVGPVRDLSLGSLGGIKLGPMTWPLTVVWIVGMTNAFNFMDGIDGIAGVTAVVASATLAVAAASVGSPQAAIVAAVIAAGSLGFLSCNWPPARIFMGDVGSTFLGFTFAALPLAMIGPERSRILMIAAASLWPFIFDAGLTLLKRLLHRENILEGHESHLYQRLVLAGWSHQRVAAVYGILAAVCGGLAVATLVASPLQAVAGDLTASAATITPIVLVTLTQMSEARVASSVGV